jgi:hypothetical protein
MLLIVVIFIALNYPSFSNEVAKGITPGPVQIANAYFQIGQVQSLNSRPSTACSFEKDHRRIFCQEGYYFQETIKAENNLNQISIKKVQSKIISLGSGMAMAALGKDVNWANPYQVDGWGFIKTFAFKDFAAALPDSCMDIKIPVTSQKFCLWGAGRALYFLKKNEIQKLMTNDPRKLGYEFAESFTSEKENVEMKQMQDKSSRNIANILKLYYFNPKIKNIPKWAFPCVSQELHILNCIL